VLVLHHFGLSVYAHSNKGEKMKQKNQTTNENSSHPDVVKEYTDSIGRKLLLSVEFKMFNDRPDISAITIRTTDLRSPITRRMLSEIPLDKLFRDELAIEVKQLTRTLRNRKGTSAHQGRQHSDEDLQAVAEIYKAAFLARLPVQKAVADAFGISVSTAAKRIMASRQQGFIQSHEGEK
jgi:hypothetical protein